MKNWYFAECKSCKEVKTFFCNNPLTTAAYFSEKNADIGEWFVKHYGCELSLGWRDDHLDALWEQGYTNKDLN